MNKFYARKNFKKTIIVQIIDYFLSCYSATYLLPFHGYFYFIMLYIWFKISIWNKKFKKKQYISVEIMTIQIRY